MNVLMFLTAILPGVIAPPADPQPPSPPVLVGQPEACLEFSPEALAADHQPKTFLAFLVTTDGEVAEVMVTRSSGSPGLDRAAMSCVRKWRFRPALKNGVAIDSVGGVAVDWPKR